MGAMRKNLDAIVVEAVMFQSRCAARKRLQIRPRGSGLRKQVRSTCAGVGSLQAGDSRSRTLTRFGDRWKSQRP